MSENSDEEKEIKPFAAIAGEEEIEFETETSKKNVFLWAMYDLANTIYSMIIVTLIISRYVLVIGQLEVGLDYDIALLIFGIVSGIMQVGVAICVPLIGALSDTAGKRKPYVISLTGIILLFASLLGFFQNLAVVLLFYVIANVAYQFSLTFYDAMLPFIAKREDIPKVSGFGVAWGYLGTLISLIIFIPLMFMWGDMVTDPDEGTISYGFAGHWETFVLAMFLFFIFALPFFFVREKQKKGKTPPFGKLLSGAYNQVKGTFKDIRKHRPMFIFIIGYFLVADIANVLVGFMTILVRDALRVGFGTGIADIFATIFILISTVSAVIFTYFVGKFGEKLGGKNTFYLVGGLWTISLVIGVVLIFSLDSIVIGFNLPFIFSIMMGLVAGPALGGTWTAQRIMVAELAPKEKFGEYFGFSKLSGKLSSALGPIVFTSIYSAFSVFLGSDAYGISLIAVGIIMAIGIYLISSVEVRDTLKKKA
ncbi:MAG: MFS transporter [Candidatus Lokiarchaeota archaeon]|nr:MFS transporter [Candidatus Lokiarchaeota archaeon]